MAISFGSKGAAVEALQTQLTKAGFSTLGIDGNYGANTESAVQRAYASLGVPGVSGAASDELIGALTAKVGTGKTVIGATPPGDPTVTVSAVDASPSKGAPLPVKIGLAALGLAVVAGAFWPAKRK